jgi:hypothetical protein
MIHRTRILVMAAFSLLSVLTIHSVTAQTPAAQATKATSIPISYLPYTITAPGTYVLTRNLSYTGTQAAIGISEAVGGPVVLDLKGFTIMNTAGANTGSYCIFLDLQKLGSNPTTIRNGTITGFVVGIIALNGVSSITISNLIFNQNTVGVDLEQSSNSIINKCQFNGFNNQTVTYGIDDRNSPGGNTYDNNTFTNIVQSLTVFGNGINTNVVLDRCQFAPPPSN